MQLPNGWEFVVLTLACLRAGIVPVMALPAHRRTELAYLAAHAEAAPSPCRTGCATSTTRRWPTNWPTRSPRLEHVRSWPETRSARQSVDLRALCAAGERAAASPARPAAAGSRDVAVFLLSGGTTGLPKLIARTHDDYAYNARRSAEVCGIDADTVYLVAFRAGHNFPLACPGHPRHAAGRRPGGHAALARAGTGLRDDRRRGRHPHRGRAGRRAAGWTTPPSTAPTELATLRVLQVGGARLADELARRMTPGAGLHAAAGVRDGRGAAQLHPARRPRGHRLHHPGPADVPGRRGRLVDELDQDVPTGEPGSLLTRGPYTPRGYYRAAEQNARAFTADGWYRSGDICAARRRATSCRGPGQGHDQPRRGEDLRRGGGEPRLPAAGGQRRSPPSPCPTPCSASGSASTSSARAGATVALDGIRAVMDAAGVAASSCPNGS